MRIPTISLSNPQSVRKSLLSAPVHVNFLSVAADESLVVGPINLLRMCLRIQLEHSDVLRDASSQRPAQRGFFAYPHSHTAGNSLSSVPSSCCGGWIEKVLLLHDPSACLPPAVPGSGPCLVGRVKVFAKTFLPFDY